MFCNSLIPFFDLYMSKLFDGFRKIDTDTSLLFLIDRISYNNIREVNKIYNRLLMKSIYKVGVGHSISAASMKGTYNIFDVPAILFETAQSEFFKIVRSRGNFKITKKNVLNIFGKSSYISGNDEDLYENGALPSHFVNPNVFDTACLTVATCSQTLKYVPFCQQVLVQGENFNDLLNEALPQLHSTKYDNMEKSWVKEILFIP